MTDRGVVSVYAVGDDGATGGRMGSAVLVEEKVVLVYPPLDGRLAGAGGAVRVAIPPAEGGFAEVIDATVLVVAEDPLLVLLSLAHPSAGAVDPPEPPEDPESPGLLLFEPDREATIAALRAKLAGPPPREPRFDPTRALVLNAPRSWICRAFGIC